MFRPSQQQHDLGFKGTPSLPNQKWHVYDSDRPHPTAITPGSGPGTAPSDAVPFDGKDRQDGYLQAASGSGDLFTRAKFGDCQLHVEWQEPVGATIYRDVAKYTRHEPKEPLLLQGHNHPVRFRNIWIRPLGQYDSPER